VLLQERVDLGDQLVGAPGLVGVLLRVRQDGVELEAAEEQRLDEPELGVRVRLEQVLRLLHLFHVAALKGRHDGLLLDKLPVFSGWSIKG
jgi:hypothetical protein